MKAGTPPRWLLTTTLYSSTTSPTGRWCLTELPAWTVMPQSRPTLETQWTSFWETSTSPSEGTRKQKGHVSTSLTATRTVSRRRKGNTTTCQTRYFPDMPSSFKIFKKKRKLLKQRREKTLITAPIQIIQHLLNKNELFKDTKWLTKIIKTFNYLFKITAFRNNLRKIIKIECK